MNICRYSDKDFSEKIRTASSASDLFDEEIESRTRAIVREVALRGDDALLEFTEKFDGAKLAADQLAVTSAELMTAEIFFSDEPCAIALILTPFLPIAANILPLMP